MGSVIPLNEALDRLLRHRGYRESFLAGRWADLRVADDDLAALRAIDPEFLGRTAVRLREDVRTRRHRGTGSLEDVFPRTIAAWSAAHPEDSDYTELFSRFLESPAAESWRDVPHAGPGACLEESFYRFVEDADIGDPAVREEEFLVAVVRALAVCPDPAFAIPREIQRAPNGWFAITARSGPLLIAATSERFAKGPVAPFLRELFTEPGTPRPPR